MYRTQKRFDNETAARRKEAATATEKIANYALKNTEKYMNSLVKEAIYCRKLLRLTVQGYSYITEPYCYGKAWTGQETLRAFVVQSAKENTIPTGWHLFLLSDIENFEILSTSFNGTRVFDAYDMAMFFIYCRVESPVPLPSAPLQPCADSGSCLFYDVCTTAHC